MSVIPVLIGRGQVDGGSKDETMIVVGRLQLEIAAADSSCSRGGECGARFSMPLRVGTPVPDSKQSRASDSFLKHPAPGHVVLQCGRTLSRVCTVLALICGYPAPHAFVDPSALCPPFTAAGHSTGGRGAALHRGVEIAEHMSPAPDVVLMLHADCTLPQGYDRMVSRTAFARPPQNPKSLKSENAHR